MRVTHGTTAAPVVRAIYASPVTVAASTPKKDEYGALGTEIEVGQVIEKRARIDESDSFDSALARIHDAAETRAPGVEASFETGILLPRVHHGDGIVEREGASVASNPTSAARTRWSCRP